MSCKELFLDLLLQINFFVSKDNLGLMIFSFFGNDKINSLRRKNFLGQKVRRTKEFEHSIMDGKGVFGFERERIINGFGDFHPRPGNGKSEDLHWFWRDIKRISGIEKTV